MRRIEDLIYSLLYRPRLQKTLVLLTLLAFIGSILMLPLGLVKVKLLPFKDSNTFTVYVQTAPNSALKKTQEVSQCIIKTLSKNPEVLNMELFLGLPSPMDLAGMAKNLAFNTGEEFAHIVVNIKSVDKRDISSYQLVSSLRADIKKCAKEDEQTINIVEPPVGPPIVSAVVAEIYGEDTDRLFELALEVEKIFKTIDGLVDTTIFTDRPYDMYELIIDKEKMASYGVSYRQINEILYVSFSGKVAGTLNQEDILAQTSLYVRVDDEHRSIKEYSSDELMTRLQQLTLINHHGLPVALSELVTVVPSRESASVTYKDLRKMISVTAETDLVSQIYPLLELRDAFKQTLSEHYDITASEKLNLRLIDRKTKAVYDIEFDGELQLTFDAFYELGIALVLALVFILILITLYYKDLQLGAIVLFSSMLSFVGIMLGHHIISYFTEITFFFTITSFVGYIVLIGISSRNSLLLIDFTKQLLQKEDIGKTRAIAIATATRTKPILLTASAIMLGNTLLATDPVFGGMGVALIFGTVTAVLGSLLIVPIFLNKISDDKLI